MNITNDNGDPPPPPAIRIDPTSGDLELIDAGSDGNSIVDNLPSGRDKPDTPIVDNSDSNTTYVEESSASRVGLLPIRSVLVLLVALVAVPNILQFL
jgi:hypothetical protein